MTSRDHEKLLAVHNAIARFASDYEAALQLETRHGIRSFIHTLRDDLGAHLRQGVRPDVTSGCLPPDTLRLPDPFAPS